MADGGQRFLTPDEMMQAMMEDAARVRRRFKIENERRSREPGGPPKVKNDNCSHCGGAITFTKKRRQTCSKECAMARKSRQPPLIQTAPC